MLPMLTNPVEQEEEENQRRADLAEKRKREEEEWKLQMTVEEEGSDALDESAIEKRTSDIITFIKNKKLVLLEEISTQFKMRTADVIELLQTLDKENRMMGVIDDRGKFLYLEEEELQHIANFIKRRGRVSVQEIQAEW